MVIIYLLILGFVFVSSPSAEGQQKQQVVEVDPDPKESYSEAERPEDNYLSRFNAIKISESLIDKNLESIFLLKVIVSNYKDQGWEKEYKVIYDEYKKGVGLFYRRNVVYSRVELERNRKAINKLYKKVSSFYKKQTITMLGECADKILNFSLDEANKYDPHRNKVLYKNMMRLWIAYGQTDEARKSYIGSVYKNSLFHYRIAKSYAILILEELDPSTPKGKFDVDKADNLNRVLASSSSPDKSAPATESVTK